MKRIKEYLLQKFGVVSPEEIQRALVIYNGLKKEGFNDQDEKALLGSENGEGFKDIVRLQRDGLYEPSIHKYAKEIMGDHNYFGVDDAVKYLGARPTHQQLMKEYKVIKFFNETLVKHRETHKLGAHFPKTIMSMLLDPELENFWDKRTRVIIKSKLKDQLFAFNSEEAGYYLVNIKPAIHTANKRWIEQLQVMGNNKVTPMSILLDMMTAHWKKTREILFREKIDGESVHLRCGENIGPRQLTVIPEKNVVRLELWTGDSSAGFVVVPTMCKPDF